MATLSGPEEIVKGLKEVGVDIVSTLPENATTKLVSLISKESKIIHVPLAREEEGFGISTGAYLGGKKPAIIIQNSGFLNSLGAITELNIMCQIPVLVLISHVGYPGEHYVIHPPLGRMAESVTKSIELPCLLLDRPEEVRDIIKRAQLLCEVSKLPVLLMMSPKLMRG
ncbi:MAG: thiamine pyrophosphate-binding protein [Nitrososphaerales archaeon]